MPVNIQPRTDNRADGKAGDKKHRVFAFGHVLHNGVSAKPDRRQSQRIKQRRFIFFADAAPQKTADTAARQNRTGINNRP